jgi:hypothetical protein
MNDLLLLRCLVIAQSCCENGRFERGVFGSLAEATEALKTLGKSFKANGLPPGTIPDPKRADSVLVPFGNGFAVYEIMKNGTAVLRTVLGATN